MKEDTVVWFRQPGSFSDDPLTEVLRAGARHLLAQAVEAEVEAHIAAHAHLLGADGRRRVARHGHLPERLVQTGIGAVPVRTPRTRDRAPGGADGRIRLTSSILPPCPRRAKSVEELLLWLTLKGISTGDFSEALATLLGPDARGLTASTISRPKAIWWDAHERCCRRDRSARASAYHRHAQAPYRHHPRRLTTKDRASYFKAAGYQHSIRECFNPGKLVRILLRNLFPANRKTEIRAIYVRSVIGLSPQGF